MFIPATRKGMSVIIALLMALPVCAQTGHFYPSSLFSSGLVSDLCQDKYGNIWIATDYGLNRFDGYHFTTWLHNEADSTTIRSNTVASLLSDGEGGLWVGTNRGLDHYSPATNTFRHFRFPGDIKPRVTEICRFSNDSLFICTAGFGGYTLHHDGTLTLNQRYAAGDEGYYRGIYEDSRGRIWKYAYNQTFVMTDGDRKVVMQSTVGDVLRILECGGEVIIVGVYGLMAYDGQGLRTADIDMSLIAGKQVLFCAVEADAEGNIYIGTRSKGLYRIPCDKPQLERVEVNAFGIDLNTAMVWDIMIDRKGNLWTGLQNKGLMMIPQRPMQFSNWSFGMQNVRLGASVSSVCEGDGGMTWCTVQGIGVYGFDGHGRLTAHPQAPADVEFIYRDSFHRYWLGTDDGLYSYDPTTGRSQLKVTYECEKFNTMTTDADGNIYISAFSRGICIYNPTTGQLRNYNISMRDSVHGFICNNWVMAMTPDRDGCIWMATASGISCYDPKTSSFRPQGWHQLLNGVMCFSLCELNDGNFAIGTEQGLYLYDRKTKEVAPFPGSEQLSDKTVTYILQAKNGDIWCSTSMGLWQWTRKGGFIGHINGNGLTTKEYLYGVGLHTGDDRIFFGTNDGLTTFLPDQVKSSQQVTDSLWLTEFIVINQPVSAETVLNGVHITRQAVPESDNFQLSYHDNTFTMVFSQLNFRNPSNVAIEYRINEGDWLRTNYGTNSITLSQMRPGTYHIDIRALVGGGYSPVKRITVTILAPWYRTTLAYACYLLLLLLLLGYIAYAWRRHAKQQLDEERMKFLINATHDIRSPLTLIMGPLAKMKETLNLSIPQSLNPSISQSLNLSIDTIDRNAKRILNLVNQILDVRKIDKQQMQLHCKPVALASFIRTVCRMYDYNARERQIQFTFTTNDEETEVWIDPKWFDKVIANLLSNAFKFSREGGCITVRLTYTERQARLQVIDDGIGMDENTLKHVFDRFYQGENSRHEHVNGTGIGLNLCKMIVDMHHGSIEAQNRTDGQGSVFTVCLPLGSSHLKEEEKDYSTDSEIYQTSSVTSVDEQVEAQTVQKSKVQSPSGSRRPNVLLVDDDEELGQYISKELSHYYKFTVCLNGKEGLKELLSGNYQLVLSDVMMPEMDGFTMLRLIKTNSNISHIPVIMLSSKADIGNRLEGLDRGADAFLPKPFDMEELHKTIDNLIQSRLRLKGKFTGAQDQTDKLERPEVKGNNELLMERIMKAINQNMGDSDFNVDRLSQEVGISRAQLHRKMKEMTGISPSEFIRNIRLEQAARLLREQKINVTQVTYIVGFANLAHFSTVFRKHFGVSPSDYAEQKR